MPTEPAWRSEWTDSKDYNCVDDVSIPNFYYWWELRHKHPDRRCAALAVAARHQWEKLTAEEQQCYKDRIRDGQKMQTRHEVAYGTMLQWTSKREDNLKQTSNCALVTTRAKLGGAMLTALRSTPPCFFSYVKPHPSQGSLGQQPKVSKRRGPPLSSADILANGPANQKGSVN